MPEHNESPLEISLFGSCAVHLHGVPLPRLRSRKNLWLLALLALRGGRGVERGWLAGTLWPDSDEAAALVNLRSSLADLRRALGPEAGRLRSPRRHTLCLELADAEVDVVAFDAAIAQGETAALERAVALYRGPLLEGCTEEWVAPERDRREQAYLAALETLAAQVLAVGDPGGAERYLRRAVSADPLRESAQRALMEALAHGGNEAAALLVFRELRMLLQRELNAEPDAATTALFQRLRAEARLRAQGRTEKEGPGPSGTPLSHASASRRPVVPLRLPQPLTPLIGRAEELREIEMALGRARLVTLTGTGGVGKTRLAIHVAATLFPEYPDGIGFVELAGFGDPTLVLPALASALGIRELEMSPHDPEAGAARRNAPLTEAVREFLRPKQMLLVLDNCEHLVDACARLVEMLLRECPHLRVLATSRQRLGVTGETAYVLPPLSLPDGTPLTYALRSLSAAGGGASRECGVAQGATPEHLMQFDAIRLFCERAAAVTPGFTLSAENAPAVVEVCRQLEGIPLAMELAAARLNVLPVEQIAARLEDRLRLLTSGSRTALPRHRTLRATLDWSYDLLSEPEQLLLRRLSVFAGGWTLDAAEAVCSDSGFWDLDAGLGTGGRANKETPDGHDEEFPPAIQNPEVLDLLAVLIDKSLVLAATDARGMRYRLHETIRQYAWERLRNDGAAAGPRSVCPGEVVRARYRGWYVALAERAKPALWGPDQSAWLDRLEAEHGNLRAALQEDASSAALPDGSAAGGWVPAFTMGAALWWFWHVRGYWSEGRSRLESLLALPLPSDRQPLLDRLRVELLHGAGTLARCQGDFPVARVHLAAGLASARQLNDSGLIAWSLYHLGCLARDQREIENARAHCAESLALMRMLGIPHGIAAALNQLAHLSYYLQDRATARTLYEESLAIGRSVGDQGGIADALHHLGLVLRLQGQPEVARAHYEEALELRRQLGDQGKIGELMRSLGDLARGRGQIAAAGAYYEQSVEILQALGDRSNTASSLLSLGSVVVMQGDLPRAVALVEQSREIFRQIGHTTGVASACMRLGGIALGQGDLAAARRRYDESLTLFGGLNNKYRMMGVLPNLGDIAWHTGEYARAQAIHEECVAYWQDVGNRGAMTRSLISLGWVAHARGEDARAHALFADTLVLQRDLGDEYLMVRCIEGLAAVWSGTGRAEGAARLLGAAEALRQALGTPLQPLWRQVLDRIAAAARSVLAPEAFAAAWAEGRAMPLEQIVAYALKEPFDG